MHLGILHTGHAPDAARATIGDYDSMFQRLLAGRGYRFTTWDVVDMAFPEDVDAADGWLISGSRHGVYEDHPFLPPLFAFIRAAHEAHVPMVGICFGHQAMAQALGGKVEKFAGGWAVGRQDYDLDGQTLRLNAWHQDQVVRAPDCATRIAGNSFCENAMLLYGTRALGIQPHPEFEDPMMEILIEQRGPGVVPQAQLDSARATLGSPDDNAALADMIDGFLRRAHAARLSRAEVDA